MTNMHDNCDMISSFNKCHMLPNYLIWQEMEPSILVKLPGINMKEKLIQIINDRM